MIRIVKKIGWLLHMRETERVYNTTKYFDRMKISKFGGTNLVMWFCRCRVLTGLEMVVSNKTLLQVMMVFFTRNGWERIAHACSHLSSRSSKATLVSGKYHSLFVLPLSSPQPPLLHGWIKTMETWDFNQCWKFLYNWF